MKILLIGYGKMGKAIAAIATQRGHDITYTIHQSNRDLLANITPACVDIALEFSEPAAAYANIYQCLSQGIPVVAGTTGWLHDQAAIEQYCREQAGTFFYASNFSIGVHIFLKLNELLAKLMCQQKAYNIALEEIHHPTKKDSPSGTAISLAEGILSNMPSKKKWVNAPSKQQDTLPILSKRMPEVPGTHTVTYHSVVDTIVIKHTAHSRAGFALGAILVAEWLQGKKGVWNMHDFLQLNC